MASTYTGLGTELMTTGENASTWGTKTNTNLNILEQIAGGYIEKSIAGSAQTTTLSVSDGSAGAELSHRIIKFTGTITGDQIVTIPLDVQQVYILVNGTSGSSTVQFKYVSGSGSSVTFKDTDKGTKLVYATADDGTNPNLVDTGIASHQIHNTLTVGEDDTGYDVKFFGATASAYMLWDESADDLVLAGAAGLVIPDAGNIGSASDTDAVAISSAGVVALSATTEASATGTAALTLAGGLGVAKDVWIGDDLVLDSDSTVLKFGDDQDTTLTHTDGTGLTLNGTNKLCFYDTALSIHSSTDGQLDLIADTEIQIAATTIDINGAVAMDGAITGATDITLSGELDAATLDISGNADIDGTLEADAITINGTAIGSIYGVVAGSSSILTTGALDSGSITSGFGAIDNGTSNIRSATITAETAFVPDASGGADLGTTALEFNDLFLNDSGSIQFGDDQDTTLTHTDGTGLTLNSTNKLCFYDTALYIHSSTDGQLDLVADTEIQIAATTIDINGAVALNGAITGATDITLSGELDAATLDISGNADIDGTTNLDAVDIDGAVQIDAAFTSGVDGQGYDTKFFGDTSSAYMLWDTSADDLILAGGAGLIVPEGQFTLGSTAVASTATELNLLDGAGTLKEVGLETIWVPSNAMTPTETNGCASITAVETTSGRPDMYVLDFDKDSDEHAQFAVAFPKQWNLGTVTFQVFWSGTANTGGVSWGLQGVACGDNDTIDVAYGTGVVVDDTEQGAVEEVNVSAASGAVTIAGSPADDQLCYFRIYRDVSDSNDDSSGDARLHGVKVFYTTDAANDA